MATVIDEFIVKYILDTSSLDKRSRDTEKRLNELKTKSKEAGDSMGDSIEAGAKRASGSLGIVGSMLGKGGVVGLAVGSLIYAGKLLDDRLFKIAQSTRRLGIDSKNFGIAANQMRNLQYASELAGGSMEDATNDVGNLSKSLFNLKFNGQVSESLVMLSRLGVQFQDSYGRARDFNDVMLDTASAIEKAKQSGRMTDAEAFQFATQAGFTGGDAQLVTGGRANLESELAKQAARRQVSGTDVSNASKWVRGSISLGQATEAGMGVAAMSGVAGARGTTNEGIEALGGSFKESISEFGTWVDKLIGKSPSVSTPSTTRSGTIDRSNAGAATYSNAIKTASLRYNIPEEVLIGMMRTESGFNPNARNPSGASGLMQLTPDMRKVLGVPEGDPTADINAAAGYLDYLRNHGIKNGLDPQSALVYGVDAYHTGEGNIKRHTNIGNESMSYAGNVLRGTAFQDTPRPWMNGGSGNSTSVQIGDINIHTQATDANGIAGNIGDLTKRKLMAAHAETGGQ